jgi:hypothetical protein
MNAYLKPHKFYWANTNWKESNKKSRDYTDIKLDEVSENIIEFVDHKDISTRYVWERILFTCWQLQTRQQEEDSILHPANVTLAESILTQ